VNVPFDGALAVSIPSGTPLGSYDLIACADDRKTTVELDEGNNCHATGSTLHVMRGDPVVASVGAPATVTSGGTFRVTDTVTNRGAVPAGASTVQHRQAPRSRPRPA
jgi:hypothetical protein